MSKDIGDICREDMYDSYVDKYHNITNNDSRFSNVSKKSDDALVTKNMNKCFNNVTKNMNNKNDGSNMSDAKLNDMNNDIHNNPVIQEGVELTGFKDISEKLPPASINNNGNNNINTGVNWNHAPNSSNPDMLYDHSQAYSDFDHHQSEYDENEYQYDDDDQLSEYNMDMGTCTALYQHFFISPFIAIKRCLYRTSVRNKDDTGRLLKRDNAFHQSSGTLNIGQHATGKIKQKILSLRGDDWFHVVLSWPTWMLVAIMLIVYTLNLLFFALFYALSDRPGTFCGLSSEESQSVPFQTAFAFSLITSSTIGYGFPKSSEPFFNDCPFLVVIVYFQVIVSLLINAVVVGFVLQRLGRADNRSHQVLFSNKACIRCIHGRFYFMFQVYDLDRRHPVVEAHVRCYAAYTETDGQNTAYFQTRFMRLQNPNDELGGTLFLSVPCTVVHCIDQWSPLMPQEHNRSIWKNQDDDFVHSASNRYIFPSLVLREADAACGNRDGSSCPICGESFPTDQHLLRHIRYMQYEESLLGFKPTLKNRDIQNFTSAHNENVDEIDDKTENTNLNSNDNNNNMVCVNDNDIIMEDMKKTIKHTRSIEVQKRYLSTQTQAGLKELQLKRINTKAEEDDDILSNESKSNFIAAQTKNKNMSKQDLFASKRTMSEQSKNDKYIKTGEPTSVNKILKYYADLNENVSHLDVDMNLLPTAFDIVPEKTGRRRKATTVTDVFSMFDDINDTSDKNKNNHNNTATGETENNNESYKPKRFRPKVKPVNEFRKFIEKHVEDSGIEILVLVEGIEARSSNTFQARHSYKASDIEFDKFFAPTMSVSSNGNAQVNLNSFHQTIPVQSYASEVVVQSHT